MTPLHAAAALLAGGCAAPAVVGAMAAVLLGGPPRRRDRPSGLVVHAFTRRSLLDCSYVPVRVLDAFLGLGAQSCWQTVRAAALPGSAAAPHAPAQVLTFDDGLEEVHSTGLPLLEKHGAKATVFVVAGMLGRRSDAGDVHGRQRFLNAAQVAEIGRAGHEIGSHTMTHPDLTMLNEGAVRRELSDSRRLIEDACGLPVTSLAFPYGSWNRTVWSMACEAGYRAATVLRAGAGPLPEGMVRVYGAYAFDTAMDLAAKAASGHAPLAFARARVMSQFARGGPLWRFRGCYRVAPRQW